MLQSGRYTVRTQNTMGAVSNTFPSLIEAIAVKAQIKQHPGEDSTITDPDGYIVPLTAQVAEVEKLMAIITDPTPGYVTSLYKILAR